MKYLLSLVAISFFGSFSETFSQPKFTGQVIDSSISIGYGLAIGDVDGDGKADILLADKKQFVWYRNGDWKRFVMAENLTEHDNVCIAARDINGDRKVEVAVGAQWNPGETTNSAQSGSVHFLIRPEDPTQLWKPVELHHEPTVHRMQWVKSGKDKYALVVASLHGWGNKNGEGQGARLLAYYPPQDVTAVWKVDTLEKTMHLTHNFFTVERSNSSTLYLAGKEGINIIDIGARQYSPQPKKWTGMEKGAGEIQVGRSGAQSGMIATIEPMHGNQLAVYTQEQSKRILLDSNIKEGHALGMGDFLQKGSDQIVAGWRVPNKDGKVGIKLYAMESGSDFGWESYWVDENGMACEDMKIADLDEDGRLDIIASGRTTHNLKVYWNKK